MKSSFAEGPTKCARSGLIEMFLLAACQAWAAKDPSAEPMLPFGWRPESPVKFERTVCVSLSQCVLNRQQVP